MASGASDRDISHARWLDSARSMNMNKNNNMTRALDHTLARITQLLENMDVPAMRRDLDKPSNIRWLLRNVAIDNKGPQVTEVVALLIKEQRRLK